MRFVVKFVMGVCLAALWGVALSLLPAVARAEGEDVLPPFELKSWYDYALKRFPPLDCPLIEEGFSRCAAVTTIKMTGEIASGKLALEFTGENFGRTDQILDLVGPASTFALDSYDVAMEESGNSATGDDEDGAAAHLAPTFDDTGGMWRILIPPGAFKISLIVVFDPQPLIPMTVASGVGRFVTDLKGGVIQFDENQGPHGGEIALELAGQGEGTQERPRMRVTRVFQWSAIPTFIYDVNVEGIRNEAPIQVALLGDEVIESIEPEKPMTIEDEGGKRFVHATVSPSSRNIKFRGHFQSTPKNFTLGNELPFEVWIHVADTRYPVNLKSDASPIDPGEFSALVDTAKAKAFLVKPEGSLAFEPVQLAVDEGRKGKGKVSFELLEGTQGFWLEKLFLTAKILGQDRLTIPTPVKPIFAGIGNEGFELYHDSKGRLSVRIPAEGLSSKPIEVDWNLSRPVIRLLSLFATDLPGQQVYLEEQSASVRFRPGVVPVFAWGAEEVEGDMRDQFHLYGLLIGILAFFVCRGLKFPLPLALVVGGLFVGLYLEDDFPTVLLLTLLILTVPWAQLKDETLTALKKKRLRHGLLVLVWFLVFLITVVPLANYARDRIYQALHPYATASAADFNLLPGMQLGGVGAPPPVPQTEGEDKYQPNYDKDEGVAQGTVDVVDVSNAPSEPQLVQSYGKKGFKYDISKGQTNRMPVKQKEWNPKPVNIITTGQSGRSVLFKSFNVVENQATTIKILAAGPVLRGLWMILEVAIILIVLVALLKRSARLWRRT